MQLLPVTKQPKSVPTPLEASPAAARKILFLALLFQETPESIS